jgi:hypothetical protein
VEDIEVIGQIEYLSQGIFSGRVGGEGGKVGQDIDRAEENTEEREAGREGRIHKSNRSGAIGQMVL